MGKLFDANDLIKCLKKHDRRIPGIPWSIKGIQNILKELNPVDAVPVVHGRWEFSHTTTVEKYSVVKCSNCGHEAFEIAIYVKEGHYCPNCGAMMDLEASPDGDAK